MNYVKHAKSEDHRYYSRKTKSRMASCIKQETFQEKQTTFDKQCETQCGAPCVARSEMVVLRRTAQAWKWINESSIGEKTQGTDSEQDPDCTISCKGRIKGYIACG